MRITVVLVKLVFSSCRRLQNGTAMIKFYVKLKKRAIETFEMLKVHTVKNVYREQMCLNGVKGSKKLRK
jgi:hypothetical protein